MVHSYLRHPAAVAILISGYVHFDLYDIYKNIPKVGPMFLLNAIASVAIAAALVWRNDWFIRLAGLGFALSTLIAFGLSRSRGLFGFKEVGLEPSPQALIALVAEIAAAVLLAGSFVLEQMREPSRA